MTRPRYQYFPASIHHCMGIAKRHYRIIGEYEKVSNAARSILGPRPLAPIDAFCSFNSDDKAAVRTLTEQLEKRGLCVYLADRDISAGSQFPLEILNAIHRAKAGIVFLGPKGVGPWQWLEMSHLIVAESSRQTALIPTLLPGAKEVPHELCVYHRVKFDWLDDAQALEELVRGLRKGPGRYPPRQPR